MFILILLTLLCFTITVFFIVLPFFVPLFLWQHMLSFLIIVLSSFGTGHGFAEIQYQWKRKRRERHEKQFVWYYSMGLHESAYLKEPKITGSEFYLK